MTYRLKLREPIAGGVRRIGLEQIEIAEAKLANGDDIPAAIHDARRCLKRLRALVRLIRPALGDTAYRRESRRLGDIGRLLAGARDQHVMRQTLAKLEGRFGPLPNGAAQRLEKLLHGEAGSKRALVEDRRTASARLAQAKGFFARADHKDIRFEHAAEGLERAYRKARQAFRKAYRRPGDEAFHTWRKSVQLHWRHMLLLSRGWPDALGARASEAKELSQLLGEDHDLSVLLAFAQERGAQVLSEHHLAALAARCRACQAEIRARAEPHGARLFAEPADCLKERVADYWSSAGRLSALAAAEEEQRNARTAGVRRAPRRPAQRAPQARRPASQTPRRSRTRP